MKTSVLTRPSVSKRRRDSIPEILEARIAPANAFAVDTSNNLLQFDTATPGTIIDTVAITGIGTDAIVGIDFRPADGLLYALGRDGATGHIYTVNASTGAATLVSTLAADPTDVTAPYSGLAGGFFGVDFNPVPDRMRVVSNTGENLRINVQTGFVITDGNLNPGTPNIVGAGYTNSGFGATSTTLFTIDATTDQLFTQNPPNNGTQVLVGNLGIDVGSVLEFDILAGSAGSNTAFLAAPVGVTTGLYTVNLATGAATLVGNIGGGATLVRGLAVTGSFTSTAAYPPAPGTGNGPFAVMSGTSSAETLIVTETVDAGLNYLRHNRFDAGDPGFASALDFDTTLPGEQRLEFITNVQNVRLEVNGGGGADLYSITRSGVFDPGPLNVPGGSVLLTNTNLGGQALSVFNPITADRITLVSNGVELVPAAPGTTLNATTSVSIAGFTPGAFIALQTTEITGLVLKQGELSKINSPVLTLGNAASGPISIGDPSSVPSATLNLVTAAGVTQTAPLTVGGGTGTLNITAGGSVDLRNPANAFGTVGGGTTNGLFGVLSGAASLTVNAITNAGNTVHVGSLGSLTLSGAINSNGQDVVLSAGTAMGLNASITATGANVGLSAFDSIGQNAGIITSANLLGFNTGGAAAGISLTLANAIGGNVTLLAPTGNVDFMNSTGFNVGGITSINVPGGVFTTGGASGIRSAFPGTITMSAGGNVTQSAGAEDTIEGQFLVLVSTNGGSYTLTNPNNDVASIGAFLDGALNYVDIDPVGVGGAAGIFGITTTNDDVSITTVNGDIFVFNTNGTPAPDINAGTGAVLLVAGSVGAADNAINIMPDAGILAQNGVTLVGDNISIAAPIDAGGAIATVRPFQDGTLIDFGGADGVNTLGLTTTELDLILAGVLVVGNSTAGNLSITVPWTASNTNQLELVTGGSIIDANPGFDINVSRIGLTAGTGIGAANDTLEIASANIEATTDTGGIFLDNFSGLPTTIGGVNSTLTGLTVITSGDIVLNSNFSGILLADEDGLQIVKGGSMSGNVTLNANFSGGSDVVAIVDNDAITAPRGSITVIAAQDILFGTVAFNADNDVRASGSITFTASRDVTIAGFSDVASDDFGQDTGGSVVVTAGNDVNISSANGNDASIGASGSGGGDVTLTTGFDRFINITVGFQNAVFSSSGDVTLNAERLVIDPASGVTANNGMISVQSIYGNRFIDLGSVTDAAANTLEISAVELTRFFTPLLRIGNTNFQNNSITVTQPVNAQNAPTLSLFTFNTITTPAPGSITAQNLALHAYQGIGTAAVPLATVVENVAFFGGPIVNISNTGNLTVNEVDDLPTSEGFGLTTLTAQAGPGPTPGGIVFAVDTSSQDTLTANALESPQPEDDIRVLTLVDVTSFDGDIRFNAGDGIVAEENSLLSAFRDVRLAFGVGDVDGISFIDLRGFITARTLTLVGSSIHENITLGNLDKIDVRQVSIFTGVGQPDTVTLLDNALSNEINASLRLGTYIEVLGFRSEVRVYETNTADTLILAGREGDDTIVAQPGVESLVSIILDGGTGNDTLIGNGILVGGEGNDQLTGGTNNDTLIGDGGTEFLYGVTTANQLVRFSPEAPDSIISTVAITGLVGADTIVGIDVRPATGAIYALGNDAGTGRLYTIDPLTGAATFVATLTADAADVTSPYTALGGTDFGVDFNPVPDRLRVVSNTGENLRINVDTGAVTTDGAINGATTSVIGAAYANNFVGATATTLYTIDAASDSLFIQNPPNNGTEVLVGALGLDVDVVLGFDIVPGTGTALAALSVGGVSGLYYIDLFNGRATLVGNFGGGATLRGFTVGATQGHDIINGGAGNDLLVGGFGHDVLAGGTGNDRLEAGDGDDALDGGDGTDTLNGFTGNDVLTGGAGLDVLIGGEGTDTLRESRDADFTLTNAALTIGMDGAETLSGFERVELTGGASANVFNVGAYTGALQITGGDGSDTLDFSDSTEGVSVDLDAVGAKQFITAGGASLELGDIVENFTGSDFNDVIFVDAQSFARLIDGNAPSTSPGLPGAPIPPGDRLTIDGRGQFVTIDKLDSNTGTVNTPGFGLIAFDDVEQVDKINSASSGGFGGSSGATAFTAAVTYKVGAGPRDMVAGDLNGDGFDDIVSVNERAGTISVLMARGDGTFAPAVSYKTGGKAPVSLVLANVDDDANVAGGDDDLDIVVANRDSNRVSVLLNDGTGVFGAATLFRTPATPSNLQVGDFNQDGLIDVAMLHKPSSQISVLLNTGAGVAGTASYGPATKFKLGTGGAADFVIGNFDGDASGFLDFAVAHTNAGGTLRVLTGDGTGQFTVAPTKYAIGANPTVIALADFNNDGIQDVVVNHKSTRLISVLLGRGNAGGDLFETQVKTNFNVPIRASRTLVTGDFDGDGNADFAVGSESGAGFAVALGIGNGVFLPIVRFAIGDLPVGSAPVGSGIATGDFNGDGALDIVSANVATNILSVILRAPTV